MSHMIVRAGWASDIGKVRRENQDAAVFLPEDGLFAVADGMGGLPCGKKAAELACSLLKEYLAPLTKRETEPDELADRVQKAVETLSGEIRAIGNPDGQPPSYGTTLCGTLLYQDEAILFNVGDSRAYLCRSGDPLLQLTEDHTLAQLLLDSGEITPEESLVHPGRSRLTRFIGMAQRVNPDVIRCPVKAGDQLLLCSDGLYGMTGDSEIEAILRKRRSPQDACRALMECANQAGGRDNITAVLLQFQQTIDNMVQEGYR